MTSRDTDSLLPLYEDDKYSITPVSDNYATTIASGVLSLPLTVKTSIEEVYDGLNEKYPGSVHFFVSAANGATGTALCSACSAASGSALVPIGLAMAGVNFAGAALNAAAAAEQVTGVSILPSIWALGDDVKTFLVTRTSVGGETVTVPDDGDAKEEGDGSEKTPEGE
jgi:hypothetical protein